MPLRNRRHFCFVTSNSNSYQCLLRRTLLQFEFYRAFWGTRMQRINLDLIIANLFNPRHPCSLHLLNHELNVQECDATKVDQGTNAGNIITLVNIQL